MKDVLRLREPRIDEVAQVVVHEYGGKAGEWPNFDHPERGAAVDGISAHDRIRHRNEIVRIALLDVPEITECIVIVSVLVRKRDQSGALKGVWNHAIVLWIDERGVDQLATAANFLVDDLNTPINLTKHAERILVRGKQPGAAFVGRSEERLGRIVSRMHPKQVADQA